MKNYRLLLLLVMLIVNCAAAQTINISGSVKTMDGDPLHLAFVQDKQYKYAVYTDSLGNFVLTVNPNSKLRVNCRGFKDTLIDIAGKTTFSIVLRPIVNIVARQSHIPAAADENTDINAATLRDYIQLDQSIATIHDSERENVPLNTIKNGIPVTVIQNAPVPLTPGSTVTGTASPVLGTSQGRDQYGNLKDWSSHIYTGGPDLAQGAIYPQFTHKEATQGSRYLFNSWVHGYVINAKDSTIQSPVLFFNYDKIGGNLLLSKDKHAAIEVYKDLIKSFTIFDEFNQPHTFTLIPVIDKTHFVQVVAEGNNYKIYKLTKTEFIKSNYASDGVMSTGNYYDEYADENTYYVIGKNGILQKIALKKKSLKEAFSDDPAKLNQYFSANTADIDDNYLKDLGDYMNK